MYRVPGGGPNQLLHRLQVFPLIWHASCINLSPKERHLVGEEGRLMSLRCNPFPVTVLLALFFARPVAASPEDSILGLSLNGAGALR